MNLGSQDIIIILILPWLQDIFALRKKNTETPVKILILKQIYTETSEPSLEALLNLALWLDCAGISRTVGLANLTVKMGCSHYKLTREVERSEIPASMVYIDVYGIQLLYGT